MAAVDVWSVVHGERKALAADASPLTEEQWSSPSLCPQWTVRVVLAHMTALAQVTPATFLPKLIVAGFSMERLQARGIAANLGGSGADTLAHFETVVAQAKRQRGWPEDIVLGETIVHAEDIRRALGMAHEYPPDAVMKVADFYTGSNMIGSKHRVSGLRLRATDVEWSRGSGPELRGPVLSLVMAMAGRTPAFGDLSGEGVETLRGRA